MIKLVLFYHYLGVCHVRLFKININGAGINIGTTETSIDGDETSTASNEMIAVDFETNNGSNEINIGSTETGIRDDEINTVRSETRTGYTEINNESTETSTNGDEKFGLVYYDRLSPPNAPAKSPPLSTAQANTQRGIITLTTQTHTVFCCPSNKLHYSTNK